ncbi:Epidermal retinol dehydrogenase 2 [Balamuthia mandrillaris]
MKDLAGKVVLVTGGGSGIGRLLCKHFAGEGAIVVIWDIQEHLMKETAGQIADESKDAQVHCYKVDLCQREAIYDTAKQVKEEVGPVDVLINNAGIVSGRRFLECSDEQIVRTMDVNVMAHMWTVKSFLPEMIERKQGHIVSIASAAGLTGVNGLADYCASKWAAVGFDESLRLELQSMGLYGTIKTTVVCPFYINTGMFEGAKTRFPFLLPILEPEYVALQIFGAVKKDKAVLFMPRLIGWISLFRFLLPTWLFDWGMDLLGINGSMDKFKGRGSNWAVGGRSSGGGSSSSAGGGEGKKDK